MSRQPNYWPQPNADGDPRYLASNQNAPHQQQHGHVLPSNISSTFIHPLPVSAVSSRDPRLFRRELPPQIINQPTTYPPAHTSSSDSNDAEIQRSLNEQYQRFIERINYSKPVPTTQVSKEVPDNANQDYPSSRGFNLPTSISTSSHVVNLPYENQSTDSSTVNVVVNPDGTRVVYSTDQVPLREQHSQVYGQFHANLPRDSPIENVSRQVHDPRNVAHRPPPLDSLQIDARDRLPPDHRVTYNQPNISSTYYQEPSTTTNPLYNPGHLEPNVGFTSRESALSCQPPRDRAHYDHKSSSNQRIYEESSPQGGSSDEHSHFHDSGYRQEFRKETHNPPMTDQYRASGSFSRQEHRPPAPSHSYSKHTSKQRNFPPQTSKPRREYSSNMSGGLFESSPSSSRALKSTGGDQRKPSSSNLTAPRSRSPSPPSRQEAPSATGSKRQLPGEVYAITVKVDYYSCISESCEKTFPSMSSLNEHVSDKHKINEHRCPLVGCRFSSNKASKLIKHQGSAHRRLSVWPCKRDGCPKECKSLFDLSDHIEMEHMRGRFLCTFEGCNFMATRSRQAVKDHFNEVHQGLPASDSTSQKQPEDRQGNEPGTGSVPKKAKISNSGDDIVRHHSQDRKKSCNANSDTVRNVSGQAVSTRGSSLVSQIPVERDHNSSSKKTSLTTPRKSENSKSASRKAASNLADRNVSLGESSASLPSSSKSLNIAPSAPASTSSPISSTEDLPPQQEPLRVSNEVKANKEEEKYLFSALMCPEDDCLQFFHTEESLSIHMADVHLKLPFACLFVGCEQTFTSRSQLTQHTSDVHGEVHQWPCIKCDHVAVSQQEILIHHRCVHQKGIFRCKFNGCGKLMDTRQSIIDHFDTTHM